MESEQKTLNDTLLNENNEIKVCKNEIITVGDLYQRIVKQVLELRSRTKNACFIMASDIENTFNPILTTDWVASTRLFCYDITFQVI